MPHALVSLVLDTGRFKELGSLNEVPIDVVKLAFPGKPPADPGKPWNETDVVLDTNLPFMGLYWLVTDGSHWLFSYARGGIAFSTGFVMVEKIGKAAPAIVWRAGRADKQPRTFHEFQEYVRANGLFLGRQFSGVDRKTIGPLVRASK